MNHPDLVLGLIWYAVFVFSTCCHEAAHAWTAMRLGDRTAYRGGQVSLNPIPHIRREPFGMVVVPLIMVFSGRGWVFGWASAPLDPFWVVRYPRRAAWVSLAGPLANLALMLVSGILLRILLQVFGLGFLLGSGPGHVFLKVLTVFLNLNLILFIFNLLPVPPLDGSGVIGLLLSDNAARKWRMLAAQPVFAIIGLVLAWHYFDVVYQPVMNFIANILFYGIKI